MARVLLAMMLAGTVALAACSGTSGGSSDPATTDLVSSVVRRDPTPADPLRVRILGDSVMDNLAAALLAALDGGGEADTQQLWLLSLSRDVSSRFMVEREVARADADLVIVMLGVWELAAVEDELDTDGWGERYIEAVVEPFVQTVADSGAHLLWIGMPAMEDATQDAGLERLQDTYEAFAATDPRVEYLDAGEYLDDPPGQYTDELLGADGVPERVRNPDGHHFCPPGSIRVVEAVLGRINELWSVEVDPDWRDARWAFEVDGSPQAGVAACGFEPVQPD